MAYDNHSREECSVCKPEIEQNVQGPEHKLLLSQKCNGSLPTHEMCGWEGHDAAVSEVGWCAVCQHGNHPFPIPEG